MTSYLVGVDECGRGALAGPLVVCALAIKEGAAPPEGVKDSKAFSSSEAGRRKLHAVAKTLDGGEYHYCVRWVTPTDIDDLGIDRAWARAVVIATSRLVWRLYDDGHVVTKVTIDGRDNPLRESVNRALLHVESEAVVGADATVSAVSAASILAKSKQLVHMADMARMYPQYGFEKGAGYGTKQHLAALAEHGVSPIHRRSFAPVKGMTKMLAPSGRAP